MLKKTGLEQEGHSHIFLYRFCLCWLVKKKNPFYNLTECVNVFFLLFPLHCKCISPQT